MGTTQMFCLNDYLRDLQEVVDLDCGSSNCTGVTRAAEIMKRRFDAIGFAAELVDLGSQAGRGLFAVNQPNADHYDVLFNAHLDTVYPDGTAPCGLSPLTKNASPARGALTARLASLPFFMRSKMPGPKTSIDSLLPWPTIPMRK